MGICCYSICCAICFNKSLSKTLEINLIVYNSIAVFLILLSLIIIEWKEISAANIVFFILMFLMSICCLIFSIFIRLWRSRDLIKTSKKDTGYRLAMAGFTLTIINFVVTLVELIVLSIGFRNANYPCYTEDYDSSYDYPLYRRLSRNVDCSKEYRNYYTGVITTGQYLIAYFTFSYLEISLILDMIIWSILKNRIRLELDGPAQVTVAPVPAPSPQMVDPYGRAVIVVQPGDVVMMGGNQYQYNPYVQNQPNTPPPNPQYPSSQDYPIQEKIS